MRYFIGNFIFCCLLLGATTMAARAANGFFGGGNGAPGTPFIIEDAADLNVVRNNLSASYKLANDIDLTVYLSSGNPGYNSGEGWEPIGKDYFNQFIGNFNGAGHKITGLWINRNTEYYIGLFGIAGYFAMIENVGVEIDSKGVEGFSDVGGLAGSLDFNVNVNNCYVTANINGTYGCTGGLAGSIAEGATISNCYATGEVTGSGYFCGGLVGFLGNNCIIEYSYATCNVNGYTQVGGLLGYLNGTNASVSNCYATGDVYSTECRTGGLVGFQDGVSSSIINCYAAGNVSTICTGGCIGGLVGELEDKDGATISDSFFDTQTTGQTIGIGKGNELGNAVVTGKITVEMKQKATFTTDVNNNAGTPANWDFTDITGIWDVCENSEYPFFQWQDIICGDNSEFCGGTGMPGDPYLICNAAQLDNVRNYLSSYFILANDIDLTGYLSAGNPGYNSGEGWLPIGSSTNPFAGNFNGTGHIITGLWIDRSTFNNVGLFGSVSGMIQNLGIEISVAGIKGRYYTGGLVGNLVYTSTGNINNCYITGNVSGRQYVGGLVGYAQSTGSITNCHAIGNIDGTNVGGLVGTITNGSISRCYALCNINHSTTADCNSGYICYAGGLVGRHEARSGSGFTIFDCYAIGDVSGTNDVGGLVGMMFSSAKISNCYSVGRVNGIRAVGGLIGSTNSNENVISNCFFDSQISGMTDGVGSGIYTGSGAAASTTAQMQQQSTFTTWDFTSSSIWKINETQSYPYFTRQSVPAYQQTANTTTLTFNLLNAADSIQVYNHRTYKVVTAESLPAGINTLSITKRPGDVLKITVYESGKTVSYPVRTSDNIFDGGDGTPGFPYLISTPEQLDAVRGDLAAHYQLSKDIDLTSYLSPGGDGYAQWSDAGWLPIGDNFTNDFYSRFTGNFNGAGFKITGLKINRSTNCVGLFGYIFGTSKIENVGVITDAAAGVNGVGGSHQYTGGLVGIHDGNSINNCHVEGNVRGNNTVGGLVGRQQQGCINNCNVMGIISGSGNNIGGLTGIQTGGSISNNYTKGSVTGNDAVGGLLGYLYGSDFTNLSISNSYAAGNVSGNNNVGGLLGYHFQDTGGNGTIKNCYATANVTGINNVGGLVGNQSLNYNTNTVSYCYATGKVNGNNNVGGLLGFHSKGTGTGTSTISNCYVCNCEVKAAKGVNAGRIAGYTDGTLTNNHAYDMIELWVNGSNVTPASSLTGKDGLSITKDVATAPATYTAWTDSGEWTFDYEYNNLTKNYIVTEETNLPILSVFDTTNFPNAEQPPKVGNCDEGGFCGGDGTMPDPYLICTAGQLDNMRKHSGYFRLANDIDLTDYLAPGGAGYAKWNDKGWEPIGPIFYGSFSGDNHTITGLWIKREDTSNVGLFATVNDALIDGVGIEIAAAGISGYWSVGALTGGQYGGSITNCFAGGNVSGTDEIGGLVGCQTNGGIIRKCYAVCNVYGDSRVGGLLGMQNSNGKTEDCYAMGNVSGNEYIGGLVGLQHGDIDSNITNCYATGKVSGTDYTGGLVGGKDGVNAFINNCFFDTQTTEQTNGLGNGSLAGVTGLPTVEMQKGITFTPDAGWDFNTIWQIWETKSYPYFIFQSAPVYHPTIIDASLSFDLRNATDSIHVYNHRTGMVEIYRNLSNGNNVPDLVSYQSGDIFTITVYEDGFTVSYPVRAAEGEFCGGTGTSGDPYLICNAEQLNNVRKYPGRNFVLNDDIDLTDYLDTNSDGWEPIGDAKEPFTGSFNGSGHIITGLWSKRPGSLGLFGETNDATIENLGVELDDKGVVGPGDYDYVGGLAGKQYGGIIRNSYVTGKVNGKYIVGGLVGGLFDAADVTTCYFTGVVNGDHQAGGLAGSQEDNSSISYSYASGEVNGSGLLGGLVGYQDDGVISNSFFDSETSGLNNGVGNDSVNTGVTGKNTVTMKQKTTFTTDTNNNAHAPANWNFTNVWFICEGTGYPVFIWQGINCSTSSNNDISDITVDDQSTQRDDTTFHIFAEWDKRDVVINVTADDDATVEINGVPGNPRTVELPDFGENIITITITAPNGDSQTFILIIERYYWVMYEYANVPTVNCNVQTNGGYSFTEFQWYKNGVLIENATKPYYQIKDDANYYCVIVLSDGRKWRTYDIHLILQQENNLNAYPNPTQDIVTINCEPLSTGMIQVFDMHGRLVLQSTTNPFNIRTLPEGVYLIRMNGETVRVVKK